MKKGIRLKLLNVILLIIITLSMVACSSQSQKDKFITIAQNGEFDERFDTWIYFEDGYEFRYNQKQDIVSIIYHDEYGFTETVYSSRIEWQDDRHGKSHEQEVLSIANEYK